MKTGMNMRPQQRQKMSRRMIAGVAAGSIAALVVAFFFVFNVGNVRSVFASSTTYYARTNGNWESNTTWSTGSASGSAASSYPKAGDIVVISGYSVNIANADESCAAVTLDGGSSNLVISNGKKFTTSGDVLITAKSGNGSMGITVTGSGSKLAIGGNLTVSKAGGSVDLDITLNFNSQVSVAGNMDISVTGGGSDINLNVQQTAQLNISGNLDLASSGGSGKINVALANQAQINAVNLTYNCTKSKTANVTLSNTASLNLTGNIIREDSNQQNGTLSSNDSSSVNFKGSAQQVVTAGGTGGDTLYMQNFTVNNSSTASPQVVLNSNLYVTGSLTMTKGIVQSSASHMVILGANATCTGGSSTCYVNGPMRKQGTTAFVFPVGKNGVYAPIAMSAPSTSSSFDAEYFNTAYSNTTSIDNSLTKVSQVEYWDLHRASGNGSVKVTLYWNNASRSGISSNTSDLKVAHFNSTTNKWESIGNTAVTSANNAGTVTSALNSNFSPFTFGSNGISALPVTLTSFNVKASGSSVEANWTTSSEINNDYFTLERSTNGRDFTEAGKIDGHGTTQVEQSYSYEDKEPLPGVSYYRLKQTDFNGKTSYSEVREISKAGTSINSVYPNPFIDHFTIEYTMPTAGDVTIQLVNMQGQPVYEETVPSQKGQNTYSFNNNNNKEIKTGSYILRLASNGELTTYKLVKSN
jgi:hypothetical protein